MVAITSYQTALMTKIDDLQTDINRLCYDMDEVKDRTSEVESRLGGVKDFAYVTGTIVCAMQQQVTILQYPGGSD